MLHKMVVRKFIEDKSYWCCVNCKVGDTEYFNSESSAKNYAKKMNFDDFVIFQEGKN